jgi:hypothetical protein
MFFLLLGLPLLVLLWFCGSRAARFVHARTGSRPLAAVGFFIGCTIPWADAWIGVPYFYYWQRSHPAGVVYKTVQVEGYLREDGSGTSGRSGIPKPIVPYQYIETPSGRLWGFQSPVEGAYVAASVLAAPNEDCVESTEHVVRLLRQAEWPMDNNEHCLKAVGRDEPISRYALEVEDFRDRPPMRAFIQKGPWHRVNEGFFRIYGRRQRIVDRETGEVIAEAWDADYLPWLATLTSTPVFRQRARSLAPLPTLHPIAILIPDSPPQTGARTDATALND